MKSKIDKGSEKKYPSCLMTRREWALHCSRLRYGMIPTDLFNKKTGELVGKYSSRRQARKHKTAFDKLVNA